MPVSPSDPNSLPLKTRLIIRFYNLLFPFALAVLLPGFLMRMFRRGNYRDRFGQRFGIYSGSLRRRVAGKNWTWIHAVSVGEALIALKLAKKMKARRADLHLVLSTTTSTGFALASKSAADWLEVIYNPVDFPPFVRRALDVFRPEQIVLIEAEVWPNLVGSARRRGIPVSLVNARLSPRSESRFRRFRFLTGPLFRMLNLICVQEQEDIARWESLGVDRARLQCPGSIKFDHSGSKPARLAEFRALLDSLGVKPDAPVLLAGSTFAGEEKILAHLLLELRPRFPDLFLIIVPRHVERTPEVVEDLKSAGLTCALRTKTEGHPPGKIDCLVVNTTGELRDWYSVGTVIFIGKSLTAVGGQNPVEAVVAGKPVLFGPHMENFAAVVNRWLERGAAIQVADGGGLAAEVGRLLADPRLRESMSAKACQAVAPHQGATERTAILLGIGER
jgi:3-deoxy-D-manno-octulosonic-acid transferase